MLEFKNARVPGIKRLLSFRSAIGPYWEASKKLRTTYHLPASFFLADMFFCRFVYGAILKDDYLYFKMYALKRIERKRYVTYGKFVKQTKWFFTDYANEFVDSKRGFLEHYKEFCKRDYLILPHDDDKEAHAFFQNNATVFVKEDFSNCAKGVRKYLSKDICLFLLNILLILYKKNEHLNHLFVFS